MADQKKTREQLLEELRNKRGLGNQSSTDNYFGSVVDEPADIGFWDRFNIKNFGGSTEDQINYLKSKEDYKDYIIKDYNGEVVAKKKGEDSFKKLDPTWSLNPLELIKDATDVVSDVGTMGAEALGTAAGAGAGAVTGFGIGAIPGGMLGAGAAATGAEALKQTIGKALGVRDEYSPLQMAGAGLIGAAPVGLFGTGLGKNFVNKKLETPEAIKSYLKKQDLPIFFERNEAGDLTDKISQMSVDSAKENLLKNQSGLVKGLWNKSFSYVTGVDDAEKLKTATSFAPDSMIKELIDNGAGLDPSKKYRYSDIVRIFNKDGNLGSAGAALSAHVDDSFVKAKQTLDGRFDLETTRASQKFQEINAQQVQKVKEMKAATTPEEKLKLFKEIETLQDQKAEVGVDVAKFSRPLEGLIERVEKNQTGVSKSLAEETRGFIRKNFRPSGKGVDSSDPLIQAKALAGVQDTIEGTNKVDKRVRENFLIDPIEFKSIYRTAEDKSKEVLRFGAGISEKESVSFNNAAFRDKINETVRNMRDEMYNKVLKDPDLKHRYHTIQQLARDIEPYLGSEQKAAKTMLSFTKPGMATARKKIQEFDKTVREMMAEARVLAKDNPELAKTMPLDKPDGTDIMDYINLGATTRMFGDDSLNAVGRDGITSTSLTLRGQKLGGALGHFTGLATGVSGIAKMAQYGGETIGGMFTSPWAINKYLKGRELTTDVWNKMAGSNGMVGQGIRKGSSIKSALDDYITNKSTPKTNIPILRNFNGIDLPIMNPLITESVWNKLTE